MDRTGTVSPEEASLANVGFTEDANAEETASPGTATTEETETAEETSEESTEETREEGGEETSEEEAASGSEEGTEETEEEEPQGYDIMLPNQQQKNYPDELYQLAAKKFGIDPSQLESKPIKDLLKGKIDSDIDNRNLRDRLDTGAEEDDDTVVDDEEVETTDKTTRTEEVTPERQIQAITRFLDGGVDGKSPIITPQGAKLFSQTMLGAYTEMQEAQESGDPKKIEVAEMKHTKAMATFATAMMANVFPALLPQMLANLPGQTWDGIVGGKLEEREEMKEVHSSARAELMKDPRYRDLGDMVKSKAIYNFVRDNPEVLDKNFVDANNRPIKDPVKLEMARYRFVIHQIRGQNYRPPTEVVKKAMETGKRSEREMAERKANGKLSTGRTRGGMGTSADRYDPKNWAERMKRAADNANPLGTFLENSKP